MSNSGPRLRTAPSAREQEPGPKPQSALKSSRWINSQIAYRHIGLGQVVISQVGAQLAIKEFGLDATFILVCAGGRNRSEYACANKCKCIASICPKALCVIGVQAQPFFWLPQQADTGCHRILGQR